MSPWHVDVTRLVNILAGQVFRAHQDRDGVPRKIDGVDIDLFASYGALKF